jgi:hypothetical protein
LATKIEEKDFIKNDMAPIEQTANILIGNVYSLSGPKKMSDVNELRDTISALMTKHNELKSTAKNIFTLNTNYQDSKLQIDTNDVNYKNLGLRKVFDRLRNKYIVLDSNGAIVKDPLTPFTRSYKNAVLRGGKAPKISRKIRKS